MQYSVCILLHFCADSHSLLHMSISPNLICFTSILGKYIISTICRFPGIEPRMFDFSNIFQSILFRKFLFLYWELIEIQGYTVNKSKHVVKGNLNLLYNRSGLFSLLYLVTKEPDWHLFSAVATLTTSHWNFLEPLS